MRVRLRHVALMLIGAVLVGTVGLSVGSWYGGRGAVPFDVERASGLAAELLPGTEPSGLMTVNRRGYVFLAPDDFGAGYAEFHYGAAADCAHVESGRRNARSSGWQGFHRVPGTPCDGWRAERDGLVVMLTPAGQAAKLTIRQAAPDGYLAMVLASAGLGAAVGATLFWLAERRRRPVPRLAATLATIILLPAAVPIWQDLFTYGLAEPVWPVWRAHAPLLVTLALAAAGLIVYRSRRESRRTSAATASAVAPAPSAVAGRSE
ncbi:hypothetical protein LADH09A_000891 [Micromonospora sp. LAH09]|uniref:hypothetical protein n=1 Tax=Micromonospora cabrerizensis TaxID=2911213 RepID=UPI001EE8C200|nr:hypothetical protein [Micromonospora cabrerizensis]MCG5473007.1 hypothetical protein [Micromonospora cabrerizensis]